MHDPPSPRLPPGARIRLFARVWMTYARVRRQLSRAPLPAVVRALGDVPAREPRHAPALLSLAVHRSLKPIRPRCLTGSLVLYRLLREQGESAELVIGLPPDAVRHDAHAWVEVAGRDVGPPPGRGRHAAMARFS